jgi:hypothetical protein
MEGQVTSQNASSHQVAADERLARAEERLAAIEAKLERAEELYLKFMGGAGRKLLKMLGADLPEPPP